MTSHEPTPIAAATQDLNLAVIGNCVVAAMIDRRSRIVWCCLPRLDGDPVFCNLLDAGSERGFADVELDGLAETTQSYLPNTAIVTTELRSRDGGSVRITDFVPRFKRFDRLYRPAMIARRLGLEPRALSWRGRAETLRNTILEQGWSQKRQSFVAAFGSEDLDASLLQLQEIGFVSATDPRFRATVDAIGAELKRGPYLLRYATADDFGLPETAFTQTYSMAGLVVSAMRLSKSWEEAFWRGS